MKLRWFHRALQLVGGTILVGLGALLVWNGFARRQFSNINNQLHDLWNRSPIYIAGVVLLIALGFLLVFFAFRVKRGRYYAVQTNDAGSVQISVQAIDHLIRKCVQRYDDVTLTSANVGGQHDAIVVRLRMAIRSDVRIPELVATIRAEVKEYIESCSGVKVERVEVIVDATKDAADRQDAKKKTEAQTPLLLSSVEDAETPTEHLGETYAEPLAEPPVLISHDHAPDGEPQEQTFVDEREPVFISHTEPEDMLLSDVEPIADVPDELVSLDALEPEMEEPEMSVENGDQQEEEPDAK